ncbi:hypothetical protein F2Q68_00015938 [Brassica cretica]|uniref:Uncharacterized protein n=1 Tax=Brassica cretica TaxID=69181 RepID=A0A8S9HJX6_BRACR|nr:hypothetical protein F2Q68_00015938 [Brassica cretica]
MPLFSFNPFASYKVHHFPSQTVLLHIDPLLVISSELHIYRLEHRQVMVHRLHKPGKKRRGVRIRFLLDQSHNVRRQTLHQSQCWNSFLTKWCGPIFRWVFRRRRLSEKPELGHDAIVTVNTMS